MCIENVPSHGLSESQTEINALGQAYAGRLHIYESCQVLTNRQD